MKTYSGYIEICSGKTVLLPWPMTELDLCRWRFGPLEIAAISLIAGGQILQGQAAKRDAENQAAIQEYNAQVQENDAKQAEVRGAFESRRQAEAAERTQGLLVANLGTSGLVATEGAPLLLKATQQTESELDNLLIGFDTQIEASRLRSGATLSRLGAKASKSRGKAAQTVSFIQAGGTILGGFAFAKGPKAPGVKPSFPTTGINRAFP